LEKEYRRAIIVGLGNRALTWVDACRRSHNVDMVGFVEPSAAQRAAFAQAKQVHDAQLFPSLKEALRSVQADFVIDVTPPAAHEEVAMQAFEANLHVLGEKPISDDFAAAKRIVAASEKLKRTHMITQDYRFGAQPRTLRRLLTEGVIGPPGQATVGLYKAWAARPGTHYVTLPFMFVKDMGIHHFDLMRYVLDRDPVRVWARTWNQPWGWHKGDAAHTAVFEFTGRLTVTHHALGCCTGRQTSRNGEWRIDGPEGTLSWVDDRIFVTREYPPDKKARREITPDAGAPGPQDAILVEFLAAVKEGRAPECNGRDNLKSLAMTIAVVKSAQEKRTVEIAEILS